MIPTPVLRGVESRFLRLILSLSSAKVSDSSLPSSLHTIEDTGCPAVVEGEWCGVVNSVNECCCLSLTRRCR